MEIEANAKASPHSRQTPPSSQVSQLSPWGLHTFYVSWVGGLTFHFCPCLCLWFPKALPCQWRQGVALSLLRREQRWEWLCSTLFRVRSSFCFPRDGSNVGSGFVQHCLGFCGVLSAKCFPKTLCWKDLSKAVGIQVFFHTPSLGKIAAERASECFTKVSTDAIEGVFARVKEWLCATLFRVLWSSFCQVFSKDPLLEGLE